ncbi:MAG: class I SAM-dependent methyltransferase [Clostridia bacterium]|nr:class I SAM-dependent methyltransferase [Clostridia bacterium]
MQHYFIDKEHIESDFFDFNDSVIGLNLCFRSCDSIFSKNKIDDGTRALLEAIDKKCELTGHGLDLGCGLGVISIALIKKFNITFDMVDINKTAVKLSKENLVKNNVQNNAQVFYSDGFSEVKNNYDFIVTNPPIKTGKKLLFDLMSGAYEHLKQNGQLVLVIRKDHGMESLKKHITSIFSNCEIVERNKGFYILRAVKC